MEVSKKFAYGNYACKFFIGFIIKEKITPLCILTPLMKGYVRHFDNAKTMSSLIGIEDLWLKYKEIWKAIENIFRRRKSVSKSSVKCSALGYLSPSPPPSPKKKKKKKNLVLIKTPKYLHSPFLYQKN